MRRKASKLVLISTGAALAWFLDPVSGSDRRRQVADRLSGLTGGAAAGSDPTGGAAPPGVPTVQPSPASEPALRADFDLPPEPAGSSLPPEPAGSSVPPEPDLAQAVEAATGGEKVLRSPDDGADAPDQNRSTLRATW